MARLLSRRTQAFALLVTCALLFAGCAADAESIAATAPELDAAALPDGLLSSNELADEIVLAVSAIGAELDAGTFSFDERFSRRCRQLEGVHSPVDPLIGQLDRFYASAFADHFLDDSLDGWVVAQVAGEAVIPHVMSATPDSAVVLLGASAQREMELVFQEGRWRIDSCDVLVDRNKRKALLANGAPVVTVDSGTPLPVDRAEAMIASWATGNSSYYPWLSMRCRTDFIGALTPTVALDLMAANGHGEGFTEKEARKAASTGEVLDTLAKGREHLLLPRLVGLGLADAGADAITADEVTIWVTIGEEQSSLTTRWIEEAGNLYNDECSWTESTSDS